MDIGCELHGYLSDLTRTWPTCGSFNSAQVTLHVLFTNLEIVFIALSSSFWL